MNFRKDFLTTHGFTAAITVCKEIKFLPKENKAVFVMESYKDSTEYSQGCKPCLRFEITVDQAAYEAFVASSDIYTKAINYLTSSGKPFEGAQVIEVVEPGEE